MTAITRSATPLLRPPGAAGSAGRLYAIRADLPPRGRVLKPIASTVTPSEAPQASLSRYRGGVYSSTVQTIRLRDGREARTDLIRLNPDVDAYSLDIDGAAPGHVSQYRTAHWDAAPSLRIRARKREIEWILHHSYPAVGLAALSARLRRAGYPLGPADIRAHEAIAATQAAIWRLTNDVQLDTRPRWEPVAVTGEWSGVSREPLGAGARRWSGTVASRRPLHLEFDFEGAPQLGSYAVSFGGPGDIARLRWHLERSSDGNTWSAVPSSAVRGSSRMTLPGDAGGRTLHTQLGVGATLADGANRGFRFYRLVVLTDAAEPEQLTIENVRFTVTGVAAYRNPERIVHLYGFLLRHLADAEPVGAVDLLLPEEGLGAAPGGLHGPYFLRGIVPHLSTRVDLLDTDDALVTDQWGRPHEGPIEPDVPFFVRSRGHRSVRERLRIAVTVTGVHSVGEVLLGSRTHGGPPEFTPLARLTKQTRQVTHTFSL